MDIRVLGWESSGLRCPDMRVEISDFGAPDSIHLIQMPNGTGKTTTLNLISACLSGSARHWSEEQILTYRRLDSSSDEGIFVLRLQVGGAQVGFELSFDFFQRTCCYRTSNPEHGGIRDGWKPLPALRRYFNKEFIEMVVFDGELASRLLDPKHTQAEQAIDALCQLDFFSQMSSSADHLWRNAKLEGALDEGQIQSTKRRIEKVRAEKERLESEIDKAKRHLATLGERKASLESDKISELDRHAELREKYNAAEQKVGTATRALDVSMLVMFESLRNPVGSFSQVRTGLYKFKDGLDRARLPESTSKRFFEEIIEGESCICGAPFNEPMRDQIREKMGDYLSDESTGVLNLLKDAIAKFPIVSEEGPEKYGEGLARLRSSYAEYFNAEQEKNIAERGYSGPGAEELSYINEEIGGLNKDIRSCESIIESRDPKLKKKKDELDALEDELAEAQNSRSLKAQVAVLDSICRDAVSAVRSDVKSRLLEQCNEDIPNVLRDNPVNIEKIDGAISLVNQTSASVGQTLAVGYVFLSRLFSYAAHSFPFVVDSPVGPLDNSVREQVGALIPGLGRQFIAFTISSERGGFVSGLESMGADRIQFLTIHRSRSDINVASVASGREAFFSFHSDKD